MPQESLIKDEWHPSILFHNPHFVEQPDGRDPGLISLVLGALFFKAF